MVMCSRNARIIEAHAPSTSSHGATSYFAQRSLASSLLEKL
jgi:hypothetical protein